MGLFDDLKKPQQKSSGLFNDLNSETPQNTGPQEKADGLLDTLGQGLKGTGQAIGATIDTYTDDIQGVVDTAKSNQELQQRKDSRLQSFMDDFQEGVAESGGDAGVWDSIKAVGSAAWDNPAGAGLAVVEQLPNSVPALAGGWAGAKAGAAGGAALGSVVPGLGTTVGGVVGGITGGLAGMFGGNALIETGHKAMDKAGDGEFTEAERQAAIEEGATKAGVITAVDMATLGAGRLLSRGMMRTTDAAMEAATRKVLLDNGVDLANQSAVQAARQSPEIVSAVQAAQRNAIKATDKLGKRAVEAGTLLTMESAGEGVGEYLGELAATGEANISDAVLEAAMSLGQSSIEAGYNMVGSRGERGVWGEQEKPNDVGIGQGLIQPTPTPENPDPAPVDRPDPNNGPISAAANKMQLVQTGEDLGIQFPEQLDWSEFDQPAAKRGVQAHRGFEGLDGLIATAERMGFTDETAQLITARRLFQQADQARAAGDEVMAGQFAERGNRLYRSATEVNDQIREVSDQFPAPYVATGEVTGGELGPFQGPGRTGETFDQPLNVGGPASLGQQQTNRLSDSGIIFGEEPADARATRQQRENERQQRQADDFSARYGQEGQTPYRSPVIEGELDRSSELPSSTQQAQLPPGTGQIDMGRDQPARSFTPAPSEYDGVGRNVIERQQPTVPLLENRKTISQAEMIDLTQRFRQAVTTRPEVRTDEQKQLIKQLPNLQRKIKTGSVPVTQNMQSDVDPQLAGQPIDSEWTSFAPESGTLSVPRSQMPQVKAENRGALVNFLNARGVDHEQVDIDPLQLKPTQQEFAPGKVDKARQYQGGDRSILISSDGHVVDGHHQWMAKREQGEPIKAIQLKAPIRDLLPLVIEFPSSEQDGGAAPMITESDPITEPGLRMRANGEPFATETAAMRSLPYRQNKNFASVVPVGGGFAVRVDTQAQGQAESRAATSAQERSDQSKRRMYRKPDTVNDDMLDAIALLGGIDRAEAEAQGIDSDVFGRQAAGIRYVFTRTGGDSFDGMAERIAQYGYLDVNADRLDDFSAKLDAAINGGRKIMTPEGYEALAEKQVQAEAQLQQERIAETADELGTTSDEAWMAEAANMAENAGVPEAVIQNILTEYQNEPTLALVELNDAIEQSQAANTAGSGTDSRRAEGAEAEGIPASEPLTEEAAADIWGSVDSDPDPLLTSYTEADLQAQADAQAAADQAKAQSQREAEQRAQADAERDDFALSGSDRPADVAASRGQNDMFGAGSANTEPAKPSEQSTDQQPESTEQTGPKKQYIPTGIQSGIEATGQLNQLINNGEPVTADEVRRVFDYVAGNETSIRAELNKLKKDQLKRLVNGHVWSDTKKSELVDRAYESMIGDFRFIGSDGVITSSGYGVESVRNQAREHVKALTDEQVAEYAKNRKAMIDERMAEHKARIDRLTDPQTLEDYREAIRVRGIDKLTPEQRTTYDRLIAENTVNQQQPSAERAGLQNGGRIELGEPEEATHGKTGETIFNVKVVTRLGKDKFKEAAAFARSMKGGYYRGNFYFKSREDAELFSGWVNGESVDLTKRNQQRQEQKQANAADKLKAMADRLEGQANEALNADRKENTAKRMREADYARANAEKDAAMAAIMRGVAESDSPLLKGMTQKVQVELMERMANSLKHNAPRDMVDTDREGRRQFKQDLTLEQQVQLARMPIQDMHVHVAKDLANDMIKTKGFKLFGQRLLKATRGAQDSSVITLDNAVTTKVVEFADKHTPDTSYLKDLAANHKRLRRMGITNKPTLRTALLEYMQIRDGATGNQATPNRLQALERDLQRTMVGNRRAFNDFFPTPEAVAEEVIGQAEIEPGMRVLEPSAGNGMLADAAKAAGAEVNVVEMGGQLREILSEKGYNLVGDDFLEYQAGEQYDRIVMNPPFSKDQDIAHVSHAYGQLKPGGRLVAIVSSMAGDRANTRNRQFREWLDNLDAVEQLLPEGAFLSSMNQTGVNTKMLVIDKPEGEQAGNAPQAGVNDSEGNTVTAHGVTVEVPTIDQQLVDDHNRATHMGRGRDFNEELRSEAENLLNELAERRYMLDTSEQKAAAKRMIESYLQKQAEFSQWDARFNANNPSWIVTGRSGRNMSKANRANERHMDEYTKRVDQLKAHRDGISGALYSMRPQEVKENQAVMADLREFARLAGIIAQDMREDKGALAAETRKWASPKAHKLLERIVKADREQVTMRVQDLDGREPVQELGGLAKILGPRSKAGKLVDELLTVEASRFSREAGAGSVAGRNTNNPDALTTGGVVSIVTRITADWANAPNTTVVTSESDLPADLKEAIKEGGASGQVEGVFHKGQVYLIADMMPTKADVERVLFHEALGHYGLKQLYGPAFNMQMQQLWRQLGGLDGINRLAKKYNINLKPDWENAQSWSTEERNKMMVDELIAYIGQMGEVKPDLLQRIAHMIRQGLRKLFGNTRFAERLNQMTDVEVLQVVAAARQAVTSGEARVTTITHNPQYVRQFNEAMYGSASVADAEDVRFSRVPDIERKTGSDAHLISTKGASEPGAVEPTDPGSNTGVLSAAEVDNNTSTDSVEDDRDVRFSRKPEPFNKPDETHLKVALRKVADKFQVLKDLQKNIKDAGGTVDESNDAYLAEELFHGKTEEDLRKMRETFVKPLAEKMAKFGIEQKELDQYLYAKHAPERNAHIAEINPELQEAGSGISDSKAAEIVRKVQESGKEAQYEQLAKLVYDMLATRRETMRNAGLEEDGMIDAWENSYEYYVPLKGWAADEEQDAMARSGKGFNIAGKESKRALGRSSEAASPSSFAIQDLTETLIRSRKNQVGNALLKLAEDNPNASYWQVFTNDNPDIDRQVFRSETEASKKARADAKKAGQPEPARQYQETVREAPIPMAMMPDKYFQTKRDGQTYFIKLEDERLMKAMKNIGPDTSNFLIQTLGSINRVLSSLNTSYNPEFVVGNFARDVQTAILNLSAEQSRDDGKIQGEKIAKQTVKDIPKAMRAVYRGLRNKDEAQGGEWQKWFTEFREAGAKTGWFDMKDIDGQAADLESLISMAKGGAKGKALKWWKTSTQFVEDLNGAVENAVRLSAYVNARKAGISQAKAASLAKNMTVNFNRRGEVGTTLNAFYMFANASIQGSMNFARTMIGLKGQKGDLAWQRLNTAQKIAVGLVMGSFAIAMMNRAAAGEDDDGENWYDKVPDYVKERNLVIMKSLLGGDADGSYWSIPLPYGYNIFHVFGNTAEAVTNGNTNAGKAATDLALAALGSFSPIGFQDSESLSGLVMRNITPTLGKPIADLVANENFMASSIYNENFAFGTPKPDSQLGRRSTPEGYKAIAEFLNDVSGGSEWRSGQIDINPDVMRYLVNYFTGAAGKFVFDKAPNNVYHLATLTPIESREALFWSRVSGRVLPYADREKFYDRRDEIGQMSEEWKGLTGRDKLDFYRENRGALALRPLIKSTEKQLKFLRTRRDRIYAMDLPAREQDRRLEAVEADMKRVIDRFNREYAEATAD